MPRTVFARPMAAQFPTSGDETAPCAPLRRFWLKSVKFWGCGAGLQGCPAGWRGQRRCILGTVAVWASSSAARHRIGQVINVQGDFFERPPADRWRPPSGPHTLPLLRPSCWAGPVAARRKTAQRLLTVACSQCGLGRIDPLPTEQELADWYTTAYRQQYKGVERPALRHVLRAGRQALERWRWVCAHSDVVAHLQGNPVARTLDIGASSGEFVALMQRLGFTASGIEPHQGDASYARQEMQLAVLSGTLRDGLTKIDDASHDLITMFHVLEHLAEPVRALQQIGAKLTAQGVVYIEVPNGTRPGSPHYLFFRALTLYFTGPTLRRMVQAAGLQVVSHSADDAGNLSIVACRQGGAAARRAGAACLCPLTDAHGLWQAQRQRRWLSYLWRQCRDGQPLRKWTQRQEEKRTAAQYPHGAALLADLYQGAMRPPGGV